MIKELLLLPIRLLGLVFMAIGGAIEASQRRAAEAERLRIAQAKADERERLRREREAARATRAAQTEATRIRREQERAKAEQLRAAKAAERVREAQADLAHLDQMRQDLRTLADYAERIEADAATDARKAAAFQKRMAIDQKLRSVDRQRERLQFVVDQGGR